MKDFVIEKLFPGVNIVNKGNQFREFQEFGGLADLLERQKPPLNGMP